MSTSSASVSQLCYPSNVMVGPGFAAAGGRVLSLNLDTAFDPPFSLAVSPLGPAVECRPQGAVGRWTQDTGAGAEE